MLTMTLVLVIPFVPQRVLYGVWQVEGERL